MGMEVDEKELSSTNMACIEEAYRKKDLLSIPHEQLRKFNEVYINSMVGETYRFVSPLGVQKYPLKDLHKLLREGKK